MRRQLAATFAAVLFVAALVPTTLAFAEDDNKINTQQLPDSSFIYDTSIVDLDGADAYFDDQTVQVVGEVVGDSILAGIDSRHRWITLSSTEDGTTSTISVYMSTESAAKIDSFGSYDTTGTLLQVRGTFHLACSDHEGLTDLHAESVSVVEAGAVHKDMFSIGTFVPGIIVTVLGLAMMAVYYYLRERQR